MGRGVRYVLAQGVARSSRWVLQHVLHRRGAQVPGRLALAIDPQFIAHSVAGTGVRSIVVVGTNGKTTTTSMITSGLREAGLAVVSNSTGANQGSGVAGALLDARGAQWAVLECDELWTKHVVPQLKPDIFVLLDLFRDQLDRMGEIDLVQQVITTALHASPSTTLVYNADDPFCEGVALEAGCPTCAFGVDVDLHADAQAVSDSTQCHRCGKPLTYTLRQYSQLGIYHCASCGLTRPEPDVCVEAAQVRADGIAMTLRLPAAADGCPADAPRVRMQAPVTGAYMVYDLAAAAAAVHTAGVDVSQLDCAMASWEACAGRQQRLFVQGRDVLINLAKNPTGLSQSLRLVEQHQGSCLLAIFINDNVADGHDVSWLWDVDFAGIAARDDIVVFAGGTRKEDLIVRLKYAGIAADAVADANDVFSRADSYRKDAPLFLLPNYTALDAVVAQAQAAAKLSAQAITGNPETAPVGRHERVSTDAGETAAPASQEGGAHAGVVPRRRAGRLARAVPAASSGDAANPLVILHLLPGLMNLYGDGGNVIVLERRCAWRGIPVEVRRVDEQDSPDFSAADIIVIGGGSDFEQRCAAPVMMSWADALRAYVAGGGALLSICGGYQMLGASWFDGVAQQDGIGVFPLVTRPVEGGASRRDRLTGHVVLDVPFSHQPVIGYENHSSRTYAVDGRSYTPFGTARAGFGNNDSDGADGAVVNHAIGTYLHGPVLSKNPEVADMLLRWGLQHCAARLAAAADASVAQLQDNEADQPDFLLESLDDTEELNANRVLVARVLARATGRR